ncbi:S-DNA-T family DNA segregation ATPase FtsK/SpoIIIE [Virgibacillus halotolerans]|uniref:DNA translocase FtsK n=1 Tax=Virgibacillus halotolerans TaxID=1071053 RepID=UPI001960173A|nr:DNA translocase FtsK [Virgibacillus halotolerans]MBM7597661.1 S-DNA-T family DNA segregation ATPase FtsK/SpoIIIE [Virgibacillus halotolerans]
MWEKWKQKIKDIFTEEVIEEQRETHQVQPKAKLQARVTYQYPENKNFRFPVIPDQQEPKKQTEEEIPAYQRKREETTKRSKRPNDTPNETPNEIPSETQRNGQFAKVYKKNTSVPFKPTEVPSPVYGFQKKKEQKEIEEVPAFKRKQEEVVEQQSLPIAEEKIDIIKETAVTLEQPEAQTEEVTINAPVEAEEKEQDRTPAVEPIIVQKENKVPRNPARQKRRIEDENKHTTSKHVPYNVMMTPRDKKKQMDEAAKRRENHSEKVIPTTENYQIPYHLLNDPVQRNNDDRIWVQQQQELLEETLKHFNVRAKVVNATQGPSVTRFEVQPELGVKVSKVKNLSDDLKLNMSARDIRIEAPIPGKNTIGIEIPNQKSEMVGLQGIFETEPFKESKSPLTIALGLSIEGFPMITNIQKMPHGLIAGATGSGKSVCINTILISLLYKASHEDVKFLLIDPKMVELAPYNGIPHLVSPVITDVKAATAALKWAVNEMEGRYEKFVQEGVRDIERYNQKIIKQNRNEEKMPFIVIVIDELADLMMISPQDVEDAISRIAQKARACGIHLLLATQRPSVDVITGLIKANIPTRIAFSVSSQVDSRTILDSSGAEKLLGKGDMLFVENGAGKSVRLQGPFVSDDEIERVTNHVRGIAAPNYLFEQEELLEQINTNEEEDVLLQEVIQFVLRQNSASTSLLQRQFKIGYNRAARLIDTLEQKGIITGQNGSKPRDILVTQSQLDDQ